MQADFSRDSVTPLDTSKKLTFKVNPYDSEVKSFSYEIRTSDGSKVLENKKIKNLVKEDQYLSVDVEIGSDLRMIKNIHARLPWNWMRVQHIIIRELFPGHRYMHQIMQLL